MVTRVAAEISERAAARAGCGGGGLGQGGTHGHRGDSAAHHRWQRMEQKKSGAEPKFLVGKLEAGGIDS